MLQSRCWLFFHNSFSIWKKNVFYILGITFVSLFQLGMVKKNFSLYHRNPMTFIWRVNLYRSVSLREDSDERLWILQQVTHANKCQNKEFKCTHGIRWSPGELQNQKGHTRCLWLPKYQTCATFKHEDHFKNRRLSLLEDILDILFPKRITCTCVWVSP